MEPMSTAAGGGAFDAAPGSFQENNFACELADAHMVAHTGAICDDCGGDHGVYPVTQRGVRYLLCESCYEYAAMVANADVEPEVEEEEDDFQAEEDAEWLDEPEPEIVGSAAWWAGGEQDARDNGAYGLLMSAGNW